MAASTRIRIRLINAKVVIAKCSENYLLAGPWRDAMTKAVSIAKGAVISRTPTMTGRLEANVTDKVDSRPVPSWAIVTASAENKGFRYPFALEAGHATRKTGTTYTYHYASFRTSTRHWFSGSLAKVKAGINGILNDAAHAVEQRWNA